MSTSSQDYELYYWPFLQGRGEFVRLVLEEVQASYRDVVREAGSDEAAIAGIGAVRSGSLGGVRPYAPPVLKCGDLVIAQTAVICSFLGERHDLVDASESQRLAARHLQVTVCDVADEAHNTHHPISTALTYEQQAEAAKLAAQQFVNHRLGGFLTYFEAVIADGKGDHLLGSRFSYVDLALFQLLQGLRFAFPRAMTLLSPDYGRLIRLEDHVAKRPRIKAYLSSQRRMAFNNHGVFRQYPELDCVPQQ